MTPKTVFSRQSVNSARSMSPVCRGFKGQDKGQTRFEAAKTLETMWFQGFRVVRGTGLELTRHRICLCCSISKSTANKTSVEVVRVRQRESGLPRFIAIRLKIRLNFMAARNVPVPLAQKTRWTDDSPLPKSRGCFYGVPIHIKEEPSIPCATRNWRFFL